MQNLICQQNSQFVKMKLKVFCKIFQELSVARNCLRPETAPLTILDIKRRLWCNFVKNFNEPHFMGDSSTGLKFSNTIEF